MNHIYAKNEIPSPCLGQIVNIVYNADKDSSETYIVSVESPSGRYMLVNINSGYCHTHSTDTLVWEKLVATYWSINKIWPNMKAWNRDQK